jgi:hypothetical protein
MIGTKGARVIHDKRRGVRHLHRLQNKATKYQHTTGDVMNLMLHNLRKNF